MDQKKLYKKYDNNDEYIYFNDKTCSKPFNGHIEDYDNGVLWREADVVDGYMNGIYKEYYENSTQLELITYKKNNLQMGLYMDFYLNGCVQNLCIVYCNDYYDTYSFDENGKLLEKEIWPKIKYYKYMPSPNEEELTNFRNNFNLEKISEEIQRDGKNFDYEKYFGN